MDKSLEALALFHGIQLHHEGGFGVPRTVSEETLVLVLRALGLPLESPEDAPSLLETGRRRLHERLAEPVVVVWDNSDLHMELGFESEEARGPFQATLVFQEDHESRRDVEGYGGVDFGGGNH